MIKIWYVKYLRCLLYNIKDEIIILHQFKLVKYYINQVMYFGNWQDILLGIWL